MLAKLLPYIETQDAVPASLMLEALNFAADTIGTSERRKIANEIMAGAGAYLRYWYLKSFITAEMSDGDALGLIAERRAFVERAGDLMPRLLSLFKVRDESVLKSVLAQIDDCCHDFPIVRDAPHEKKARKTIISGINEVKDQIASLSKALEVVGRQIDIEFDHHMSTLSELRGDGDGRATTFERFREELRCLSVAADIVLFRENQGQKGILGSKLINFSAPTIRS